MDIFLVFPEIISIHVFSKVYFTYCIQDTLSSRARLAECAREQGILQYFSMWISGVGQKLNLVVI